MPELVEIITETELSSELASYRNALRELDTLNQTSLSWSATQCNTIHFFLAEIQAEITAPILNLLAIVKTHLKKCRTSLILGTVGTCTQGLYQTPDSIIPTRKELRILTQSVVQFNIGHNKEAAQAQARSILQSYFARCDVVVLECTECARMLGFSGIPKGIPEEILKIPVIPVINTLSLLVEETFQVVLKTGNLVQKTSLNTKLS